MKAKIVIGEYTLSPGEYDQFELIDTREEAGKFQRIYIRKPVNDNTALREIYNLGETVDIEFYADDSEEPTMVFEQVKPKDYRVVAYSPAYSLQETIFFDATTKN